MIELNVARLIIAGSRNTENAGNKLERAIKEHLIDSTKVECIISGGSGTVDFAAEALARKWQVPMLTVNARWDKLGRAAGPIRNQQMAKLGTILLVIHDGKSPGTKSMIDCATRENLNILTYEECSE